MGLSTAAKVSIVGVIGIALFSAGILQHALFPQYYMNKVYQKLKITSDSPNYHDWLEPSVPIYMQFYFFSTDNWESFPEKNVTPILTQMGPYTFREHIRKDNVTFEQNQDIVSYYLRKWFHFEPNMSSGNLSDEVTIPNIPLLTVADKTDGQLDMFQKMGLNNNIRAFKAKPFVTATVEEILFEGYQDDLMIKLEQASGRPILPDGRFAFYYKKNGTGSYFAINTGEDPKLLSSILGWNDTISAKTLFNYTNYQKLPYWYNESCNSIIGTDGSQFSPSVTKEMTLYLFSTDLCRSISLAYEKDTEVEGIPTFRFTLPDELLASPSVNPENECYCKENCYGSGLLSLKTCKKGAPVVVSPPHFYKSDSRYLKHFLNLNPDKSEHETYLDIEPTTGIPIRAAKRLQVNVAMRSYKDITILKKLPSIVYPIFWINESVVIPHQKAERLRFAVMGLPKIAKTAGLTVLGVGAVILLFLLEFLLVKACRQSKTPMKLKIQPIPPLPSSHYIRLSINKETPECVSIIANDKTSNES